MNRHWLMTLCLMLVALAGCETIPEEFSWLASPASTESQEDQKTAVEPASAAAGSPNTASQTSDRPGGDTVLRLKPVPSPAASSVASSNETPSSPRPSSPNPMGQFGPTHYEGWALHCQEDNKKCLINHQVMTENGQVLLRLTVMLPTKGGQPPVVTALLPLGFHLPYQARLYLGFSPSYHRLVVHQCVPQGCVAVADQSVDLIEALQKEPDRANVVLQQRDSQELITIGFSAKGFAKAYTELLSHPQ